MKKKKENMVDLSKTSIRKYCQKTQIYDEIYEPTPEIGIPDRAPDFWEKQMVSG